jgi:DNA repair exonuclease SbcCD nuclease subunit
MDREIRILHTADTHLGYRQYHSEVRRQDFFKAFETVIQDAVDMQVDAVVHAGDLFDSRNPTLEDLLETMTILSRLKIANIPFFGIVGNHESKQNTQWLDLFEEMGLAIRLGKKPQLVGDVAIYGIDSVPKSKIPLYDYSGFEIPESLPENCRKLLVMHQIVQPFPYADWDCAEVVENMPFEVDAILLGDYHEYEKLKVGETWVTYSGSTERNSASEKEPRSYSIITLSGEGLEISKRTIPTRNFLFLTAKLDGEENPYDQIFSTVSEHLEELPESVVFLDISGDSGSVLSFSEIEEYLLSKGVLVSRVKDERAKEALPTEVVKVAFSDPDRAVAEEIRKMSLNDGGLIVDEVIRNPDLPRSRVDEETENRLLGLIEAIDFKDPDFMIKIPVSPVSPASPASPVNPVIPVSSPSFSATIEPEELEPADVAEQLKTLKPAIGTELAAAVVGKSENSMASPRIQRSESLSKSLNRIFETPDNVLEAPSRIDESPDNSPEPHHVPIICETESAEAAGLSETDEAAKAPVKIEKSEVTLDPGVTIDSPTNSRSGSPVESPSLPEISQEIPGTPAESFGEDEKRTGVERNLENKTGAETGKLSTSRLEASPEIEEVGKTEKLPDEEPVDPKLPDEKPAKAPDKASKHVKQSQKKGKGKPAVPRQYNLGDYL